MASARYIGGSTGSRSAEAVHRGEAAIAFDQGAEARLVAVAAVLAPARDAHDHQLGIERVQLGRAQGPCPPARPAGNSTRICRRLRELAHDGAAGVGAQVERHALLVAAIDLPRRLDALDAPRAQRVALRRLDLDHLGAEIGELQRQDVAGDEARQVDDADPVQGPRADGVKAFFAGLSSQRACRRTPACGPSPAWRPRRPSCRARRNGSRGRPDSRRSARRDGAS